MTMTKRKTSILALGATATLMALAPTAVHAVASYGTTAQSCEYVAQIATCGTHTTSGTCGADTNCAWKADDSVCDGSGAFFNEFFATTLPGPGAAENDLADAAHAECAAKTSEAICTGTCEWITSASKCTPTEANLKTKVTNEIGAVDLYRQMKCGYITTDSDCSADSDCEWGGTECTATISEEEYKEMCAGISSSSSSYGNTAHSCEYVAKVATCQKLTTSGTCGADTNCVWKAADSECDGTETLFNDLSTTYIPPVGNDDLTYIYGAAHTCSSKAEADCTSTCEWIAAASVCIPTEAVLKAGVKNTIGAVSAYREFKCGDIATESACSAESNCEWENTECTSYTNQEDFAAWCPDAGLSPASRLTKVSAVVSAVFVAALASLA